MNIRSTFVIVGLLFCTACGTCDTDTAAQPGLDASPGDTSHTDVTDIGQLPDLGPPDSSLDTGSDTAPSACDGITCDDAGTCVEADGQARCECDDGYELVGATSCQPGDVCAASVCEEPNRSQCVVDPGAQAGFRCDCDQDFALVDDTCMSRLCDGELVQTSLTVYDMTPLPSVTNPIRDGFDPLLKGDTVRVVTEVHRTHGDLGLTLQIYVENLNIDQTSLRLDGQPIQTADFIGPNLLELELEDGFIEGRLAFDATIPHDGAELMAVDARVFTRARCPINGSASGARLQLAGFTDAKHSGCNNMSDLRALQISTAIPDKNTSVYEERNGTFAEIGTAYKVLTQMTLCLERRDNRTVSFSGSADGTRPWTIDNFLLIETYSDDPALVTTVRTGAYLTTSANATAPSSYADNSPITILKHGSMPGDYTGSRTPSFFTFPSGVLQLDDFLPVGQQVWMRITGLDTGVAGHLSRLFINSGDIDEFVPECRTFRDCPTPESYNGSSIVIRSGCLDGQCVAEACASDAACGPGRRCIQDFCTDGCTSDAGCGAGEVCGQGQCVELTDRGCRTFADCPTGEVCFFGQCQAGCFHPVNRRPTYGDNNAQYSLCRLSPEACPRCDDASNTCWYNYCRECEIDAHCGQGQVCADFECVPE